MSGVGKLKALFEPTQQQPSTREERVQQNGPAVVVNAGVANGVREQDPNSNEADSSVMTPWGVRLRSVKMVRSFSASSVKNTPTVEPRRSSEVDRTHIPLPSQIKAKSSVHLSVQGNDNSDSHQLPVHKPPKPLPSSGGTKKGSRPPIAKKPSPTRSTVPASPDLIKNYAFSPTFPGRETPVAQGDGLEAQPVVANGFLSNSPSKDCSPLEDAAAPDNQVSGKDDALADKNGSVNAAKSSDMVNSSHGIELPSGNKRPPPDSPLHLRRNPESHVGNVTIPTPANSVMKATDSSTSMCSTTTTDSFITYDDSGMSTPVLSVSPLMSATMIDELFEKSSLSFSADPTITRIADGYKDKPQLHNKLLDLHHGEPKRESMLKVERIEDDDFLFPLEHSCRNSDASGQLRLSDHSSSENDSAIRSPALATVQSRTESSPGTPENEMLSKAEKDRRKRYKIASELLETEKYYVSKLRLITEDFRAAIAELNSKGKVVIPDNVLSHIFLNIRQIYTLSHQILTDLQSRMDNWEEIEEIGDVISTLAPFLMLYTTYTAGFEDAIKTLTEWTKKEKKFDALVKSFEQQQTLCQGLGIADFMLEPVQRIPRYKLLLESYLKHLEEDTAERDKTEKALNIIREAANKANSKIHQLENTSDILTIQRSLIDWDTPLLIPSRRFIKKGLLLKCARKNTQMRMFFLFNDILLHAVPSGAESYKCRNELPLYGMQIREPKISSVGHSFYVISTSRSLQLAANSADEKLEWLTILNSAIKAETQKRRSLKRESLMTMKDERFAMQAPVWIQDKSVSMCMVCAMPFKLMFRRHHCRGCGKVLCNNCTQWKVYLPYLKRIDRVCFECYHLGSGQELQSPHTVDQMDSPTLGKRNKGLLNLSGTDADDAVTAGYLHYQDGRKWVKHWYLLRKDMALYRFKAPSDVRALESIPLPGYVPIKEMFKDSYLIRLKHPRATHNFRCETEEDWNRWSESLKRASNLEFSSEPAEEALTPTRRPKLMVSESMESYDSTEEISCSFGQQLYDHEEEESVSSNSDDDNK